jgi:hypothetical protein
VSRINLLGSVELALFLALAGCAGENGAQPGVASPDDVADEPEPNARDADVRARKVVGANLDATINVEKLRPHPLAPRLAEFSVWGALFDGSDVKPIEEVDRVFVAAANARDGQKVIVVVEHQVEAPRVKAAIQNLIDKSEGEGGWIKSYDFPAARVKVKGKKSVVMAVAPNLLVLTSARYAKAAASLSESGGLPEPTGEEALIATADEPAKNLDSKDLPKIPDTVSNLRADVTLADDGGADVAIDGESSSPEQAQKDAEELTKNVDDKTSIKMSVLKLRLFDAPKFEADGSKIKSRRKLSQAEIERLLGAAKMMMPD